MPKKIKLKIDNLKVQSFVTSFNKENPNIIRGGIAKNTEQFWCTLGWCPTEYEPGCSIDSCDPCPA